MIRQGHKKNLPIFLISVTLLFVAGWVFIKSTNFLKPSPEVVEIPEEVKKSIQNLKAQKSFKLPILMYHYVEYVKDPGDTIRKSLNILPAVFEEQVKTLKKVGYEFITLADLNNALRDKITISPKSVILTFDDGYRDFYTDVFPLLKKYQVKAVVFIVPHFLDKPNNLTSVQLEEIIKSNLVEIGAHTLNHSFLVGLSLKQMQYEVEGSKNFLEKSFNIKVTSFAYPYGAFDNSVIDVVEKAGFTSAVTSINGVFAQDTNRFFLYRIRPGGRMGTALLDLFKPESWRKSSSPVSGK